MIAMINVRNKRTKTRVQKRRQKWHRKQWKHHQSRQSLRLHSRKKVLLLQQHHSRKLVTQIWLVNLDTHDDSDYRVEKVSSPGRQKPTVDKFIDQPVSADALTSMQTAATHGTSRTSRAKGKSAPTKMQKPRECLRRPENPCMTRCDTPQLGVAKTLAPDTRVFLKEGPMLVQSRSQTQSKRMKQRSKRQKPKQILTSECA